MSLPIFQLFLKFSKSNLINILLYSILANLFWKFSSVIFVLLNIIFVSPWSPGLFCFNINWLFELLYALTFSVKSLSKEVTLLITCCNNKSWSAAAIPFIPTITASFIIAVPSPSPISVAINFVPTLLFSEPIDVKSVVPVPLFLISYCIPCTKLPADISFVSSEVPNCIPPPAPSILDVWPPSTKKVMVFPSTSFNWITSPSSKPPDTTDISKTAQECAFLFSL